MSIIYEALKKVEQDNRGPDKGKIFTPLNVSGKKIKKIKENNYLGRKFFLSLGIIATILTLSLVGISSLENKVKNPALQVKKPAEVSSAQQFEELIPPSKIAEGYFLEGIVFDDKDPFAIINGRVVAESDTIDNYSVVNIGQDKVELSNLEDNSQLVLSLELFD